MLATISIVGPKKMRHIRHHQQGIDVLVRPAAAAAEFALSVPFLSSGERFGFLRSPFLPIRDKGHIQIESSVSFHCVFCVYLGR